MFKKLGRLGGWFVGAVLVGPVVGVLAGLLIDPNPGYMLNLNVYSAATIAGFFLLVGAGPSLAFGLALLTLLGGSYLRNVEVLDANKQKFNQRIRPGRGQAALTKEQINDIIQGTAATPTNPATPSLIETCEKTHVYNGMFFGRWAANVVSRLIAGDSQSPDLSEGRIYNPLSNTRYRRMMWGANGMINPLANQPDHEPKADVPPAVAQGADRPNAAVPAAADRPNPAPAAVADPGDAALDAVAEEDRVAPPARRQRRRAGRGVDRTT